MTNSIELIKKLRQATGAGIQDCRKALEQADEDYGKALGNLRAMGMEKATQRVDKPAIHGVIELYSHGNGRVGVMVEVDTETDFTARSTIFRSFAHEIALQIAAAAPHYVRDEDIPARVMEQEAQKAASRACEEGKPEPIIARIVEGTLKKFKDKNVLLRQAYIRDEKVTIGQLLNQAISSVGENIIIRRFVRWELDDGAGSE